MSELLCDKCYWRLDPECCCFGIDQNNQCNGFESEEEMNECISKLS